MKLKGDLENRAKVRQICEIINSGIQPLQNLKTRQKVGVESALDDTAVEWSKYFIDYGFQALEKTLFTTSGRYCVGDDFTAADACLVPQVANAFLYGVDMTQFPVISRIEKHAQLHHAVKKAHPENQPDYKKV